MTHFVKKGDNMAQARSRDAEVQGKAVDVPAEDIFDNYEGRISLEKIFGGINFAAFSIMAAVQAKKTVNVVEEVRRAASCWEGRPCWSRMKSST